MVEDEKARAMADESYNRGWEDAFAMFERNAMLVNGVKVIPLSFIKFLREGNRCDWG